MDWAFALHEWLSTYQTGACEQIQNIICDAAEPLHVRE
jgi:hypothetical protein